MQRNDSKDCRCRVTGAKLDKANIPLSGFAQQQQM
jgi:hypothetical protein